MEHQPSARPIDKDISEIANRAATDPEFMRRVQEDPIAAAHSAGFRISWREIREALGMHEVPEERMHEALRAALPNFHCSTTIDTGSGHRR